MPSEQSLDSIPLWSFFVICVLVTLLAIEVGLRLGGRRRRLAEHEQEGPVGTVAGATLGLLAFMMAFAFGVTASRFDTRKELLLDEVNAIGTAYLRAGLLQEPHRNETRRLLREYVDGRVEMARRRDSGEVTPAVLQESLARSEAIQDRLWSHAAAMAAVDRSSEIDALFISSLNEMFDLHTKRVVVSTQYRTPLVVWVVLIAVSMLAMASVGFQFGLAGRRSLQSNLVLALTFSAVMLLICDLDRPFHGWLTVSQQPMLDLQQKLSAQTP